jgi:hypothetical protein
MKRMRKGNHFEGWKLVKVVETIFKTRREEGADEHIEITK